MREIKIKNVTSQERKPKGEKINEIMASNRLGNKEKRKQVKENVAK